MQSTQGVTGYLTVKANGTAERIIKKSRFIGGCFPVESEEQAAALLVGLKKQYWDATHNCYAYRIGPLGNAMRSSDDGEPSGTAGSPILHVLVQRDVTNVLLVVTRYFGGVLLGAGGLIRAYSGTAADALQAAGIARVCSMELFCAAVAYPQWPLTEALLKNGASLHQTDFSEQVNVSYWVKEEDAAALTARIIDRTDGRVRPVSIRKELRPAEEPST